jgi:hypothetical protein
MEESMTELEYIKNIALLAAFYAATEKGAIGMEHIARAARREHQKLGRDCDPGVIAPPGVLINEGADASPIGVAWP